MRLILLDHGGDRVRGDSLTFASRSAEWAENCFLSVSLEHLSLIAARLFDESEGRFRWRYRFTAFGPEKIDKGYDVFTCCDELEEAPPETLRVFSTVICRCRYVGYVSRTPPVLSLAARRGVARAGEVEAGGSEWRGPCKKAPARPRDVARLDFAGGEGGDSL